MTERPPEAASPEARPAPTLEALLSRLLRAGIFVSIALMALGTALSYLNNPTFFERTRAPTAAAWSAAYTPRTLLEVFEGVGEGSGRALVVLGLLTLVATPVARVAVSLFSFVKRREHAYAVLAALVLGLLLLSFELGRRASDTGGPRVGAQPVSIEEPAK
ncbi:MAG: DUF1634 domain-containing protein [Myxococcales bacterium]|jgi:uncharacterized membrane protein